MEKERLKEYLVGIEPDSDMCEVFSRKSKPDGVAMTFADRLERDKAIARAAFEAARQSHGKLSAENGWEYDFESADEYLQSEEFKKLVGEM